MTTLSSIAEIKHYFKTNKTPIYFISATNFNLLGIDEWVSNFYFITLIDSFNGKHPKLFSPKTEIPHEEFSSIEDINNYLLTHPEVIEFIASKKINGDAGKALFLMFDEKTEALAKALGLEVCFPKASLRNYLDNKVNTNRIAEKAGVECVPNLLSKVNDYQHLKNISKHLGDNLVIQTPFGDSGHTTFFISNEQDFEKYKFEIIAEEEVKIMKRINCYGTAIEGCVTQHGTLVGPLMTELVGFKELTPYKGGWCGNEILNDAFNQDIKNKAEIYTQKFGDQLFREGYKGYFELDYLIDKDSGNIYLGELNPRVSGVSSLTNHAKFAKQDIPLFLFHLCEWLNLSYNINTSELVKKWSMPDAIDSWSQLVIKYTKPSTEIVISAPETGIWEMKANGNIDYLYMKTEREAITKDNEAFFFQITQKEDYMYEGADLGILILKGRLMTPEFELTERGKRWIAAIRSKFISEVIDAAGLTDEELYSDRNFKFL